MSWRSLGDLNPCFSLERAARREAEETRNRGLAGVIGCATGTVSGMMQGSGRDAVPAHQVLDR